MRAYAPNSKTGVFNQKLAQFILPRCSIRSRQYPDGQGTCHDFGSILGPDFESFLGPHFGSFWVPILIDFGSIWVSRFWIKKMQMLMGIGIQNRGPKSIKIGIQFGDPKSIKMGIQSDPKSGSKIDIDPKSGPVYATFFHATWCFLLSYSRCSIRSRQYSDGQGTCHDFHSLFLIWRASRVPNFPQLRSNVMSIFVFVYIIFFD